MRNLLKHKEELSSNKGVLGMDTAKSFMLAIFTLVIIGFAVVIAISSLNDSSAGNNDTQTMLNNVSDGVVDFFGNAGTWFSLLAVVVIILVIALVIVAVQRFGNDREVGGL